MSVKPSQDVSDYLELISWIDEKILIRVNGAMSLLDPSTGQVSRAPALLSQTGIVYASTSKYGLVTVRSLAGKNVVNVESGGHMWSWARLVASDGGRPKVLLAGRRWLIITDFGDEDCISVLDLETRLHRDLSAEFSQITESETPNILVGSVVSEPTNRNRKLGLTTLYRINPFTGHAVRWLTLDGDRDVLSVSGNGRSLFNLKTTFPVGSGTLVVTTVADHRDHAIVGDVYWASGPISNINR